MQTLLLAMTVFGLMVLAMGYDYVSANIAHTAAQKELDNQKRINQQMIAIQKEQQELEKKTKEIQARIDAIKKLRESQQGPSAVLQEIKARFDAVPGLYLTSIEQKDSEVTIKGESPNEYAVTKFGQSLEFSGGLFSNLNIETQRETAKETAAASASSPTAAATSESNVPKPEVVVFTVKASFGASKLQPQSAPAPANQVAMKK
jgi:Tfp pilus assembly protein PilN